MKYKNNMNIFTFGYRSPKQLSNWWPNTKQFFRNFKFAYQRATKGFADCDIWSLDGHLSNLIPEMLIALKESTHGIPDSDSDIENLEDWQAILEEIAEHFHNTLYWEEDIPINKAVMEAYEKMQSHLLSPYEDFFTYDNKEEAIKDRNIWLKLEDEAAKFREDEKNIAFDMLKKWYFDLWD